MLERLGGWLLPPRCVLCLDPGQPPVLDLCAACERDLPANDHEGDCTPPFDAVVVPYRYAWPADAMVRAFKYDGQLPMGRVLGHLLAREVRARRGERLPDLVVPVPLHPDRERERGYNQAWELARVIGRRLGLPASATACERIRPTAAQAGLAAAARRANLRDAFAVRELRGARCVALVDDVMTTGATLGELARVLRAAGVERVEAWAIARA